MKLIKLELIANQWLLLIKGDRTPTGHGGTGTSSLVISHLQDLVFTNPHNFAGLQKEAAGCLLFSRPNDYTHSVKCNYWLWKTSRQTDICLKWLGLKHYGFWSFSASCLCHWDNLLKNTDSGTWKWRVISPCLLICKCFWCFNCFVAHRAERLQVPQAQSIPQAGDMDMAS